MGPLHYELSTDFADRAQQFLSLPQQFVEGKGMLIFKGRNEIRCFAMKGRNVVVKRFKANNRYKQWLSLFSMGKAKKSFLNGKKLSKLGINTPLPIGYVEMRRYGMVVQDYYACELTDWQPIVLGLIVQQPYDKLLASSFARFVAMLHEKGVLHKDLNSTNVLYRRSESGYDFQLIDINRMRFATENTPFSEKECFQNLTLFSNNDDMFHYFLCKYIESRGWSQALLEKALDIKATHDKHWEYKQMLKRKYKR